jgi:histidine triad (HIT) family protein
MGAHVDDAAWNDVLRKCQQKMTDHDCIFCRIAAGDIPANIVYENKQVVAFRDINPQAPVHVVIIPRKHIASLATSTTEDVRILGGMLEAAKEIAKQLEVDASGYRVVNNCGRDAQQSVQHVHFHVLGGRQLGWPPG